MLCNIGIRNPLLRSRNVAKVNVGTLNIDIAWRSLQGTLRPTRLWTTGFSSTIKTMVDVGMTVDKGPIFHVSAERDDSDGYASGRWKREKIVMGPTDEFTFHQTRNGTKRSSLPSEDGKMSCGYASFRGKRASMEDFYDIKMSQINGQAVFLFGIFDGHGGSRAAEYLKEHLFVDLMRHPQFITNTKLALSESYQQTDKEFLSSEKDMYCDDGSTASTAVLVGRHLYVANVGDSRTVISKSGRAIPLSEDHKPNRIDERRRIESAGGVVMWAGTWRVSGILAMSRAFGNRMLKQFVVAEPEIQDEEIDEEIELLVLASDGLWDVVPNEDAVSLACGVEEAEAAALKLAETAFSRGSADNITCIVVRFHHKCDDIPASSSS